MRGVCRRNRLRAVLEQCLDGNRLHDDNEYGQNCRHDKCDEEAETLHGLLYSKC
jgi:hypothetical protein